MPDDEIAGRNGGNSTRRQSPAARATRGDGGDPSLGTDEALELLGNDARRAVLACLREYRGEDVPLEAIAQQVVAVRSIDASGGYSPVDARYRTAVALHHVQLPKLEAAGVVAYDRDERICRYLGDDTVEALLDAIESCESP